MNDVMQIRVGKHLTGIIGLKTALAEAQARCRDMSDDRIGKFLLDLLSKRNYIEANIEEEYALAFVREYKKHIGDPVSPAPAQGIQIKVLGMGCPQCDRLEQDVMSVMAETGINAELEHVRDPAQIAGYGVMGSPALLINGKAKVVGSVPPKARLRAWIEEAARQGATVRADKSGKSM
jgi:small redox-active disulfide protein 2